MSQLNPYKLPLCWHRKTHAWTCMNNILGGLCAAATLFCLLRSWWVETRWEFLQILESNAKSQRLWTKLLKPSITNSTSYIQLSNSTQFILVKPMAGTNPPRCRCHGGSPKHLQCGTRPWGRSGCLADAGERTKGTGGELNVHVSKKKVLGSISRKSSNIVLHSMIFTIYIECIVVSQLLTWRPDTLPPQCDDPVHHTGTYLFFATYKLFH